jgi:hypothetical protein
MAKTSDDIPAISSIRQRGVEVPIPEPSEVRELLARNMRERALLRSLLGLSVKTAEARSLLDTKIKADGGQAR